MPVVKKSRYFAVWLPVSTRMNEDPASPDYERWLEFDKGMAFHSAEVPEHLAREYDDLLERGHLQEITAGDFALIRSGRPLTPPDSEARHG